MKYYTEFSPTQCFHTALSSHQLSCPGIRKRNLLWCFRMIHFHTHLCLKLQVITSFTPRAGMQRTTIPRALDLEIKGCTIFKYFTTPACAKWKSRNKVDRDVLIWHEAPEKQKWFIIRTTLRALLGSTWQNNLSKRKGHQETLYFCGTQFYLLLFLPFFKTYCSVGVTGPWDTRQT